MDQENGNGRFHDNESGDIYDLYNACNGVLHNGRLDIRKLDQLSEEETEALDLPRLREVWLHTASGCAQCEAIVNKLNSARRRLRESVEAPDQELAQAGSSDLF